MFFREYLLRAWAAGKLQNNCGSLRKHFTNLLTQVPACPSRAPSPHLRLAIKREFCTLNHANLESHIPSLVMSRAWLSNGVRNRGNDARRERYGGGRGRAEKEEEGSNERKKNCPKNQRRRRKRDRARAILHSYRVAF